MRKERPPARQFDDPISTAIQFSDTQTKIAIIGHPIHAMMVAFPISLAFGTLMCDVFYWFTADVFWTRVALWASGMAFAIGVLAGIVGTIELLAVPGIRMRAASWTHFTLAVMLLSVMGLNWGFRLPDPEGAVLPWGGLISALVAFMTAATGWHGGKLVFDYRIGTRAP